MLALIATLETCVEVKIMYTYMPQSLLIHNSLFTGGKNEQKTNFTKNKENKTDFEKK